MMTDPVRDEPIRPSARLVRVGRRLVVRSTVPVEKRPAIDLAALIEEERHRIGATPDNTVTTRRRRR